MRIAMLHTPLMERGGGERQILRLAFGLQKLGHEVEVFTNGVDPERCYPEILKYLKVNVVSHPFPPFRSRRSSFDKKVEKTSSDRTLIRRILGAQFYSYLFPMMLDLGRRIPKGFDIINNHNFPTEWAAFIAKKNLKVPVVWMCNEPPFWFWHSEQREGFSKINWPLFEIFDKIAVEYIDEIVVLSHVVQSLVRKFYNRLSKVVRSGVDIELFHNASGKEVRKKHELENDFVLLHVGNISTYKRQSDSVKALYYLSKNYDNVKLILDGAGSREELIKLSEKFGVRHKVLFLHSVSDEELAKVYAACDVFVFPSQIPWGLVVAEAMAAAKPVIVSRQAGASEIIQSRVNGIVVEHAKPQEIAKRAEWLMNNPKMRRKIGENAYEYVVKNLSWEKYAKNMENAFQEAIRSFGGDCS